VLTDLSYDLAVRVVKLAREHRVKHDHQGKPCAVNGQALCPNAPDWMLR